MSKYLVRVNEKNLQVQLVKREGSLISFECSGESYQVEVSPLVAIAQQLSADLPVPNISPTKAKAKSQGKPGTIVAPMPGIIVNILAKEGQKVTAGDKLLVMEAMKMENNISAVQTGTVQKICVKKGDEVRDGQELIIIGD